MIRIHDVSRTISPALAVWPGDAPPSLRHVVRKADGAGYNLTNLTLSPHTGTHADAPWHFDESGCRADGVDLARYMGRTHVVTVARKRGGIVPADLGNADLAGLERLLVHTWVSDLEDSEWTNEFPYPTIELVDFLADRGAVLLGMDAPSVDAFDSEDLPCHHRLYERGMGSLENLMLRGVPDGIYDLAALPLKIAGACGSPVRAVLRDI
ncbi:MAG: cyclase family protein [Deltaproteobacteria bacterium]|nr:cyclase family protein [Deltaproteobacteria bacterium]